MPATKNASRTPAKRTGTPHKLTPAHKQALAEGRTISATIDRYLTAVNTPKRRGRKVSKATLVQRLEAARVRAKTETGVDKVVAAQEVRDLEAKLATTEAAGRNDVKSLEADFVRVVKKFSESRGVTYGAWRDAGVPSAVLKKAGISRTRG